MIFVSTPKVQIDFGYYDVGFTYGSNDEGLYFGIVPLNDCFPDGIISDEERKEMVKQEPVVVLTFPNREPKSLDNIILCLQTIRDKYYGNKYNTDQSKLGKV